MRGKDSIQGGPQGRRHRCGGGKLLLALVLHPLLFPPGLERAMNTIRAGLPSASKLLWSVVAKRWPSSCLRAPTSR
jgi:hypothetical protein